MTVLTLLPLAAGCTPRSRRWCYRCGQPKPHRRDAQIACMRDASPRSEDQIATRLVWAMQPVVTAMTVVAQLKGRQDLRHTLTTTAPCCICGTRRPKDQMRQAEGDNTHPLRDLDECQDTTACTIARKAHPCPTRPAPTTPRSS